VSGSYALAAGLLILLVMASAAIVGLLGYEFVRLIGAAL
jgi:hypothetical protein